MWFVRLATSSAVLVAAAGCVGKDLRTIDEGNEQLGIASFEIDDAASTTTVIGFDGERNEVARLELIHGQFAVTGVFKEDYPDQTEVVGRKLDVTLRGQKRLVWETAGFAPTQHMPAHPPSEWALAAFLADLHVKPVLDRWLIGFEPTAAGDEVAYAGFSGSIVGSSRTSCAGPNCGSFTRPGDSPVTANNCGAGVAPSSAFRATQWYAPASDNQWHVGQCCPAGAGGNPTDWFARKTCPLTQLNSECGAVTSTTACKGCAGYPASAAYTCDMWDDPAAGAVQYSYCDSATGCSASSFSDDFNRTSGLGSNWSILTGNYTTDGAKAISVSTGNGSWAKIVPTIGTYNVAVTARMSLPSTAYNSGIYARSTSLSNMYAAEIALPQGNGGIGQVDLMRRNNDTWTHLQAGAVAITADQMYDLKLVTSGSHPVHLEVYLDNQLLISWEDWSANRHPAGTRLGLENYWNNSKYDSYQVTPITPIATATQAPPQGSPFIDDFNRTTGMGQNWHIRYGGFSTNGSAATTTLTEDQWWAGVISDINIGSNDVAVTSTFMVPTGSTPVGVFARSAGEHLDQTAYTAMINEGSNTVKLYRRNDWSATTLGTYSTAIAADTNYTLKLVATGSNPVHLEVWLDGVQRITYDDSSASKIASGTAGVTSWCANTRYDSFRLDAL